MTFSMLLRHCYIAPCVDVVRSGSAAANTKSVKYVASFCISVTVIHCRLGHSFKFDLDFVLIWFGVINV